MPTSRYTSRKFLLACATLVTVTVLVAFKCISDGVYSNIVMACVAAYITGNVAQKKVEASQ